MEFCRQVFVGFLLKKTFGMMYLVMLQKSAQKETATVVDLFLDNCKDVKAQSKAEGSIPYIEPFSLLPQLKGSSSNFACIIKRI